MIPRELAPIGRKKLLVFCLGRYSTADLRDSFARKFKLFRDGPERQMLIVPEPEDFDIPLAVIYHGHPQSEVVALSF